MSVKINKKELKELHKAVQTKINNSDELLKVCVNNIALRVYRTANKLTPVDTGWLRENWILGPIEKNGSYYEVVIENPVDYAEFVEYGHRLVVGGVTAGWVDGRFMLTIAEDEVRKRMDRIVKKRVEKWLQEMFK